MIVTKRWAWDAVDAAASGVKRDAGRAFGPVSDQTARWRTMLFAYGKSVWSWRLKVGVKSRGGEAGPTGRRPAISAGRRWQTNPDRRGELAI